MTEKIRKGLGPYAIIKGYKIHYLQMGTGLTLRSIHR